MMQKLPEGDIMKQYTVLYRKEADWEDVPYAEISEGESAPGVSAKAQLLWNEEGFFVRLKAAEPSIRAEEQGPLGMPCEDSCLEFFFAPCPPDLRYFNLEFNPNACRYVGFGSCIADLVRLIPDDPRDLFEPEVLRTEDGWEIRYKVPFSFVRRFFPDFQPEAGMRLRANFYKCGDLTVHPHFLSWNPITVVPVSFHRPEDFGEIILA